MGVVSMPVSRKRKRSKPQRPAQAAGPRWLAPGPWSAARMARDAVRSRDEVVAWFDTSPLASARRRQFMLMDLAGRLAEWGPAGQQWATVWGSLGLDLGPLTRMQTVPQLWAAARHRSCAVFRCTS